MFLHTFLKQFLYHVLVKFEQNRMIQTTQNFELFDRNNLKKKHFWQNVEAILEDVSVAETIV